MPTTQRWSMFDRFSSHLSYASSTQPGKNLLKNMLSPNGVFAEPSFLNSGDGSHFFLKLAEADPESALNFLQQTIGQWSKEQLYRLDAGRSSIVWSLQEIAVYKEHFVSAAKLLLILTEAENQNYANNATGVFVELFMPAPHIGPTEAPPNQRLPVLVEAINSDSVEQQKIVIKAFEAALQTPPFHLILRGEHHGVKTFPKFWSPKDFKEIIDYYGSVWTFLESVLDRSDGEIRYQILDILLKS